MKGEIVVGKFVDRDRPDYLELMRHQFSEQLGERYQDPYQEQEVPVCG
jgi:hypothetical protein